VTELEFLADPTRDNCGFVTDRGAAQDWSPISDAFHCNISLAFLVTVWRSPACKTAITAASTISTYERAGCQCDAGGNTETKVLFYERLCRPAERTSLDPPRHRSTAELIN